MENWTQQKLLDEPIGRLLGSITGHTADKLALAPNSCGRSDVIAMKAPAASVGRDSQNECCNAGKMLHLIWDAVNGLPRHGMHNNAIMFDWDDTLFPTSFVLQEVLPALANGEHCDPIAKSSPFYEPLAAHAHLISSLLRLARKLAPVTIVTSSMTAWVSQSCKLCLPELDIDSLLNELDIPVYYSGYRYDLLAKEAMRNMEKWIVRLEPDSFNASCEVGLDIRPLNDGTFRVSKVYDDGLVAAWNSAHASRAVQEGDRILDINGASQDKRALDQAIRRSFLYERPALLRIGRTAEDADLRIEAKRIDMDACLKRFCKLQWVPNKTCNVISIGDSIYERDALKLAMSGMHKRGGDYLCKTVDLLDRPTLKQLGSQLRLLLRWLPQMLRKNESFDCTMDKFTVDICAAWPCLAKCASFRSMTRCAREEES